MGFERLLQAGLLLICVYLGGKAMESVYAGLVGELLVGAFLGPSGAGLVPEVEGIRLVGEVALTLLVFEGGLHVDIERIGAISKPAFLIATFGTIIPLLLGWGLLIALGYGGKESLAAGTALSSTSIGMATRLLQDNRMLRTPLGSLISVAAMVDDVLSLVILSVLQSLSGASSKPWTYARPVVASIGLSLSAFIMVRVCPRMARWVRTYADSRASADPKSPTPNGMASAGDAAVLMLCMCVLVGFVAAAGYSGSTHLLGAFLTGLSFSRVKDITGVWDAEAGAVSTWLSRVFFASIGTYVPLKQMVQPKALGVGLLFTVAAVVGKWVTGGFTGNWVDMNVVGWAMVGRGELGFVMAASALKSNLLNEESFAVTVWALLLATLISPLLFRMCLVWRAALDSRGAGFDATEGEDLKTGDVGAAVVSDGVELSLGMRTSRVLDVKDGIE